MMKPLGEENVTKGIISYSEGYPVCSLLINLQFSPKRRVMFLYSSAHPAKLIFLTTVCTFVFIGEKKEKLAHV